MKQAEESWESFKKENSNFRGFLYECSPDISKEDFISSRTQGWFPAHYAFLHKNHWHERSRMGWFGCEAKTECELKNEESKVARCKAISKNAPEAYIVSWGDGKLSWDFKFFDRFIKQLSPETILVTVDYHV